PDGFVKVLDFGLAKLVAKENRSGFGLNDPTVLQNQTAKGVILGTVNYMSPEQAKGDGVDQRTDIFSLGVVIYEMMAGRTPFASDSVSETFANLINAEPQQLSRFSANVPDELQRIIGKMLRKNTDARYQTMKDVLTDLRDLRENLTLHERLARSRTPSDGYATEMLRATTGGANVQTAETQNTLSQTVRRHKPLAAFVVAALLVGAIGLGYYFLSAGKSALGAESKKSIAVLPLKPINSASRDEIYELGIADSVIQKISSARNVVVRQLHTIRKYVDLDRDPLEIGKEQNVDFILASSYQIAGGKIKVTSQLLDIATGKVEDTFTVEKESTDLFATQDAVASAIGIKLIARFGGTPSDAETKRGTRSEEAYRLYLQGMYLVEKGTKAETKRSIELFDQAIDLDPNYAAAWAGKGNAHCSFSHMGDNSPAAEYKIAGPAIERALELDSHLPEAYATLGVIKTDFDWDFVEAEKHFLRAIELNPSSDYAYRWYGNRLVRYGRFDEAVAAMKTAINNNPTNVFHHRIYGWVLYMARRHDEAIKQLERVVEMDPSSPWIYDNLWLAYHAKGDHARAFEWFMKFHQQAGSGTELINRFNLDYQKTGWLGVLETQRAILKSKEQKGSFSPEHYRIATLSALVGDKDQGLESLNEAFKYRSANITFLKTDPALDSLRDDPRFNELLQRAGF
ncbi:MAG: tetratricopeptide repeat protein, partial [Blastocatellia bacterium]|nr:tetratricopeptide repeat protein [Blastocatellia bacterium]